MFYPPLWGHVLVITTGWRELLGSNGGGQQHGSASCSARSILHQRFTPNTSSAHVETSCSHLHSSVGWVWLFVFPSDTMRHPDQSQQPHPGAWPHLQHWLYRHGKVIVLRFQHLGLLSLYELKWAFLTSALCMCCWLCFHFLNVSTITSQ